MVSAEDVLKDEENYVLYNNIKIRKGTILAAIQNAKIFLSEQSTEKQKNHALETIRNAKTELNALGFYEVLTWKSETLNKLLN